MFFSSLFQKKSRMANKVLLSLLICLAGLIAFRVAQAAWYPPTDTPPGGNVSAPLNISSAPQTKQGSLAIGGDFLSLSSGDFLISTNDRGIFWGDEASTDLPHIEFANDVLFLSAGNTGDSIELQGDVTVTESGGNQGEFSIYDSIDDKSIVLKAETGVARTEILSNNTPLYINRTDQQDVRLGGSGADVVNLCLNDDCINSWGSNWTFSTPNLAPANTAWNVALGSNDANDYKLQVTGNLNVTNAGSFYHNDTEGITAPCPAGQVLKGVDISGGIVTNGVCSDDLQGAGGYWTLNSDKLFPNQPTWRVGIGGEPINGTKLYVTGGSVLFDGAIGSVPIEGAGYRMMWVPELGAFRVGEVSTFRPAAWNEVNIGNYSFAGGRDTMASGLASFAVGDTTTASGEASAAMGLNSTASGDYSFVAGRSSLANGQASVAIGDAQATGDYSAAFGNGIASADYSFAVGSASAEGVGSAAIGSNTHATGDYSFAGGINATAEGVGSVAFGQTTATGDYSFTAGGGSVAEGYTQANGNYAVALGYDNRADGDHSVALGHRAYASHDGSFVFADFWGAPYNTTADNQFRVSASGGVFYGATQQWDIAEAMDVYKKDNVQPGELVSLDGNDSLEKTKTANDNNLIGVVTSERTNTLHLEVLGQPDNPELERQYITLVGRVYVKVNDSGGAIIVGDPIASSSEPGIGMKANQPSKILGYAMEEADFSQSGQAEVLVFANVGYNNIIEQQEAEIQDLYHQLDELKKAYETSVNSRRNTYSILEQNHRQ
ncbi:hypothetical protein KJ782_04000 [Patescibacteria group bacterium]|nr:hypothetical protein [Patescibacteria group bacterium]